ncbi:MAG: hypothetical protein IT374_16365 [Polyangiaceae bacterium]|nr:hypothetical protein [Polyangiaceae bacterium]
MPRLPRWLVACLTVAAAWLMAATARAGEDVAPSIEAGREAEILALFAPISLGAEVTPGWRLMNVEVGARAIRCVVDGPGGAHATLTLSHPSSAPDARASRSFALVAEPAGHAALDALEARVMANDRGGFFRLRLPPPSDDAPRTRSPSVVQAWATDGIVWLVGLAALSLLLAWRELSDAPRWALPAAVGIAVVGAAVRLVESPDAALDVWPYSRELPVAHHALRGPALAHVSRALGATWTFIDVTHTTNLVVAALTPLALVSHARPLLGDHRAALLAASLVALSPSHVRFSRSDTAFIPALLLSALAFGLAHRAACDRSRALRMAATAGLPALLFALLVTRPLNVLFLPLLVGQLWLLDGRAPRRRLLALAALETATGAAFFFGSFLSAHQRTISESVDAWLPLRALRALVTPRLDTLIHPAVTPPVLLLVAVVGGAALWRGERRRLGFLLAWIALFFVGHSVVLPSSVEMQARYQLHLVIPMALLGAVGLLALGARRQRLAIAASVVLAASPLLHVSFVRDVAFDDLREHALVRRARDLVPAGCTVLEHVERDHEARFGRVGLALTRGVVEQRFKVQPLSADRGRTLRPEAEAALASPPPCLFLYEGLPCRGGAPACRAARAAARWETALEERFASRPYDDTIARGMPPPGSPVALSLRRLAR